MRSNGPRSMVPVTGVRPSRPTVLFNHLAPEIQTLPYLRWRSTGIGQQRVLGDNSAHIINQAILDLLQLQPLSIGSR